MYILPDGKVTICEELYWNEHFIIGDVTKQKYCRSMELCKSSRLV